MTDEADHARKRLIELSDEAILRYHSRMRSMVTLGIGTDAETMLGEQARKRADDIEAELSRRGFAFEPIDWPEKNPAEAGF